MTNYKNTLASLENEAGEIGQLIRTMAGKPSLSAIETDLLLDKLRRMYEVVRHLSPETPVIQEKEASPAAQPAHSYEFDTVHIPPQITKSEPVILPSPEMPEVEIEKPFLIPTQEKPTQTLSEKLSEIKTPLYEHIAKGSANKDLASTLHTKPVKTLATSIGVNDKFRYILELFGGQAEGYHKAMAALDNCGSYQEAFTYLTGHLRWNPENPVVAEIIELLKRRWNA